MWTQTKYLETNLKEHLEKNYKERLRDKLSVSDTGCLLHRQLKLWKVEPDNPPTFESLVTFDYGTYFHLYLQNKLEGEDEIKLEDEHFIGHIDKVTTEDGKLVVNEFKSVKDYGLDMILKEGKPQEEHIKQATNYVRMLKKVKENVADTFRIIYIAKCFDDSHRKFLYERKNPEMANGRTIIRIGEFTGEYDPKLAQEIVDEAVLVETMAKKRIPLRCTSWDKTFHRDETWNQYLSWCSKEPEVNQRRLNDSLLNT